MFTLSLEGFRSRQRHSRPSLPISAPSLFSFFATKRTKLTPPFSCSSALFKKECLPKPFAISLFRTLSQNTRGVHLSNQRFFRSRSSLQALPHAAIPFRMTFFAHPHPLTPIESYSCKNRGEGGTRLPASQVHPKKSYGEAAAGHATIPAFSFFPFNFKLSTVNRLSCLLCLPLSLISLPSFPFADSCTRLPSRTAAPSSSRMAPARTANRNSSSKCPTPLPHPASPCCVSICPSAPSARTDRLGPVAHQGTATVCGERLTS